MSARTTVGARTTTTTTTTTTTAGNHQHHHGESNSSTPDSIHHDDNNTDISNTDTDTGNGNGNGNPPVPPPRRKQHQHQHQHQHRQIPSKRIQRRDSSVHLPRLIRRDYAYDQSSNRVRIANLHHSKTRLVSLLCKDWFHVLLRIKWYYTIGFVMIVWYAMIWVFAFVYMGIDGSNFNRSKDCGLGEPGSPISFPTAYAFSLETCTTVGYGLPGSANGFFNSDCEGLQIAITLQMIWSMLSNAFLVSFFFSQMSKCDKRSIQLVFSKKLCVNVVRVDDGEEEEEEGSNSSNSNSNSNNHKHNHNGNMVCINVRCYDLDSAHPLVECHARIYLLDHRMKFHPLRLLEPNDDLGGVLYPSAPTTIVHHIDHHSALSPPRSRSPYVATAPTGLALRAIDSVTCNREEVICPVCGEGYGTHERLAKHIAFQKIVEEKDDYPIEGTHRGLELPSSTTTTTTTTSPNNYTITLADVQRHIETTLSEIVVVVEAIDPQLSGTFQAVQSYRLDDIEFGADFAPCMSADPGKDRFVVDLRKFHGVVYHDDMYNGGCCGGEDNNNNNSDDDDSLMSFAPPDTTANDTNNNNNNNNNNNIHGEPLGVRGVASECSV